MYRARGLASAFAGYGDAERSSASFIWVSEISETLKAGFCDGLRFNFLLPFFGKCFVKLYCLSFKNVNRLKY